MPDHLSQVSARAWERLDFLGGLTDQPPGLTRSFLSSANKAAASEIQKWMADDGLRVAHDVMGNLCGFLDAPGSVHLPLLFGSHLDTVIDAGRYDGALGIVVALAAVEFLLESGSSPAAPIGILGFCDEEGVRFQATYLGSRACTGQLDAETLALRDRSGWSLEEVIASEGWHDGAEEILFQRGDAAAYVEIHIEQGRVLEAGGQALGVVPSICGQTRARLSIQGRAEHAGTTPMDLRNDALAGAAECVLAIEEFARSRPPLVATVGDLTVSPGASNTIPGRVDFSLDLRHPMDAERQDAGERIQSLCHDIAGKRLLGFDWKTVQETPAVQCDAGVTALLASGVNAENPVPHIPSGAGHDAVMMSNILPVGMMFVRCRGGISHHPDEAIELEDLTAAIAATARFIKLWETA